jgi:hypothetical protein
MHESEKISWRMLTGNKFIQGLAPEMFSDHGCLKTKRIRKSGELERSVFEVVYDRDYGLQVLSRDIVARLETLGKDKVHALIDEAWQIHDENKYAVLNGR